MCLFIIEQERVAERFCQRLEIIKEAISDASKNQAVIRGRKREERRGGGRQTPWIYSSETQLKPWLKIFRKDYVIPSVSCATLKMNYEFATEESLLSQLYLLESEFKTNEPSIPFCLRKPEKSWLVLEGWPWCKARCEGMKRPSLQHRACMRKFRPEEVQSESQHLWISS